MRYMYRRKPKSRKSRSHYPKTTLQSYAFRWGPEHRALDYVVSDSNGKSTEVFNQGSTVLTGDEKRRNTSVKATIIREKDGTGQFIWRKPLPYKNQKKTVVRTSMNVISSSGASVSPAAFTQSARKSIRINSNIGATTGEINAHYLELHGKIADMKVDLMTTLAETKSSVQMIANAIDDSLRAFRAIRKGKIGEMRKLFKNGRIKHRVSKTWRNKTIENRHLEFTYGWSPMISDIKTGFEQIHAKAEPRIIRIEKRTKYFREHMSVPSGYSNIDNFRFEGSMATVLWFYTHSPTLRKMAKWNLFNNALLTAWELVPYSFVIDWFLPIGDFLAQYSSTDGLTFLSGSTSYKAKQSAYVKSNPITTGPTGSSARVTFNETFFVEESYFERRVHTSTPIGFPTFQLPGFKQVINGIALLSQRR